MKDRSFEPLEKVGTISKYHFQCQKNNTITSFITKLLDWKL